MNGHDEFYEISNAIASELGPLLSTRPYVAIVDFKGDFKYVESELEHFLDFMTNFVRTNFPLLAVGDHSMPISGTNLAFFKVSRKALIVIYIKKGLLGQLLVFKNRMMKYQSKLDALIPEEPQTTPVFFPEPTPKPKAVEEAPVVEAAEPTAQVIPILLKKIGRKAKFPLQEVVILNYCDGENTINDIMREAKLDNTRLWEILDKYKKKGWIKITYTGNPTFIPVLTKEIPSMAVQLGVVNKKEFEISKLCDGENTVEEIQETLGIPREELDEIIDKMEKNNIIHLEVK